MKDIPILYSGPMVRAILDDRKTQTRRVIKPQPSAGVRNSPFVRSGLEDGHGRELRCPYGQPGDRLWVREKFRGPHAYEVNGYKLKDWGNKPLWYCADGDPPEAVRWQFWDKSRPSIHMPRWASRILLEVTDVRVQRVQDISEEDALAEGVPFSSALMPGGYRGAFHGLWDSINAKRGFGWDANPWVWALTFKRVESRNV